MGRFDGRVALVTGAARGIGEQIARRFSAEGASVMLTDVLEEGAGVAEELTSGGAAADFMSHDVTSEDNWVGVLEATQSRFGGLDILVNNAGIFFSKPMLQMDLSEWQKVMSVNVDSVFMGSKLAMPMIAERGGQWAGGGAIVNLSSVAGIRGASFTSAYNSSKSAVRMLTKCTALECASMGLPVRVNSIHPGVIDTTMGTKVVDDIAGVAGMSANEARVMVNELHPMGRLGDAVDIANGVIFLASDEAKFMTGAELVVDGGWTAR